VWTHLREIVEENEAQHSAEVYSGEFPRFDEAWDALKWLLSRNPSIGAHKTVNGVEYFLYVSESDLFAKTPTISIVYTYNEDQVIVHDIRATPPKEDEGEI
jgi:hypothetical protein